MSNTQIKWKMLNFSFIIPLYNCEEYIELCIDCLMKMERQDIEIILLNDGSTDNTESVCKKLCEKSEIIHLFSQENHGVSYTRNKGIELAKGEYVIFIDADDQIDYEEMNKLLTKISQESLIDMAIYGMTFDYYHKGECYRRDIMNTLVSGIKNSKEWIRKMELLFDGNSLSPLWNKVIKRNILLDNNLKLREEMFLYEDLEFSIRCMAHCNHIYFESKPIYHYRQPEDEGNAGRRLKRVEHIDNLVNKIESSFNLLQKKYSDIYDIEKEKKNILLKLYLILAREKISVSSRKEIMQICVEFKEWVDAHQVETNGNIYYEMLCGQKINQLIFRRNYSALRHKVAVKVKNMKWYQKKYS